jgi:hypothetical protein
MGSRPAKSQPQVGPKADAAADLVNGGALLEPLAVIRFWQHQACL